jgi:hypothetical protein
MSYSEGLRFIKTFLPKSGTRPNTLHNSFSTNAGRKARNS